MVTAKTWYITNHSQALPVLTEFLKAFKKAFKKAFTNVNDSTNALHYLESIKQGKMTVSEYLADFNLNLARLGTDAPGKVWTREHLICVLKPASRSCFAKPILHVRSPSALLSVQRSNSLRSSGRVPNLIGSSSQILGMPFLTAESLAIHPAQGKMLPPQKLVEDQEERGSHDDKFNVRQLF